ncbi:MAG: DUF1772 domain-containing protein [Proteobacteria bacterium]|nr:DUF1772 domain-containing protein [Pseudomonadota bacterium]
MFRSRSLSLQLTLHVLAIVWLGVMAGFFWAYSANVALATAQMDGSLYAQVQSLLNRHVRHPVFFTFFFGPPLIGALALLAAWPHWRDGWWRILAAAGVLYGLGVIVLTAQVNLPLNAYTESWSPQALPADWAQTREAWNRANLWRVVVSLAAFCMGCAALAWRVVAARCDLSSGE